MLFTLIHGLAAGAGISIGADLVNKKLRNKHDCKCSSCGSLNKSDANFCAGCGVSFKNDVSCSGCGNSIDPGGSFCNNCGAKTA